jgi:uracil-DNA glycosylase
MAIPHGVAILFMDHGSEPMTFQHVPCQMPEQLPCKLAFVGEAPGAEEAKEGKPLIGPAGRVFNAMLRQANIERDDCLITNVFDEKEEDNEVIQAGWLKDEVRVNENFARLKEELDKAQPNVIVPLGNVALWAFTGELGISNYRGAVTKATRIEDGAKLIPTYHPSFIMRQWKSLPIGVGDFVKAAREASLGRAIVYPKVELLIDPSISDLREFTRECLAAPKLAVDIETGWGQITAVGFAVSSTRSMCIPFVDLRRPNRSYWATPELEAEAWSLIKQICESDVPKTMQNGMYDAFWLFKRKGIAVRNYRSDTRIRHKVLYTELPADLANMTATYTRIGAYKMWGGRYQKNDTKKDG